MDGIKRVVLSRHPEPKQSVSLPSEPPWLT
jgi:hypothetical protein